MNGVATAAGKTVPRTLVCRYFRNLVNRFFKILPMREDGEPTLAVYTKSLQAELLGCEELIPELRENPHYLTLLAILQYLTDHPESGVPEVKREVFRAISICNQLKAEYGSAVVT